METSLHRQLKQLYVDDPDAHEVAVDGYRIDAVVEGLLIEVQCASLAAIRDKIGELLRRGHRVLVVKPIAARTYVVKRARRGGRIVSSRYGTRRESVFDLFDDLVHFTRVFPHERLAIEAVVLEQEEHRVERRRRRYRQRPYSVESRLLRKIVARRTFRTPADFAALFPSNLPRPFTTGDLSEAAGIPRWLAQKAAYFLRETGAWETAGKTGNAIRYRPAATEDERAAA